MSGLSGVIPEGVFVGVFVVVVFFLFLSVLLAEKLQAVRVKAKPNIAVRINNFVFFFIFFSLVSYCCCSQAKPIINSITNGIS